MVKRGFRFEFEIPDEWEETFEGTQFIFHGHAGEELIVSGALIEGDGAEDQISSARLRLTDNALKAVTEAASHPDLVIIKKLQKDKGPVAFGFECWTIHSQTKDGSVLFSQAVIASRCAVLLVTFEAPNIPDQLQFYREFLHDIRTAPTQ